MREGTNDVIPDLELRDLGTNCRHGPRDLVAIHGGCGEDGVCGEQHVGMAQPGRSYVDQNFPPNRRGDVHVLELESATDCVKYKCLHFHIREPA